MRDSRRFFLALTLFLAPVILALGCLEYALRQQKNYLDIKKEKFEPVAGSVEVLILGDSHAHMGLDPARFDRKTFNLASPAQSYYYDIQLVKKYLPQMKNLKCVILSTSYFGFYYLQDHSGSAFRQFYYYNTFGIPNRTGDFDLRKYSYVALYTPYQGLKRIFKRELPYRETSHGYYPGIGSMGQKQHQILAQELIRQHSLLIERGNDSLNMLPLSKAIQYLDHRGIKIIIVNYPIREEYNKLINSEIQQRNDSLVRLLINSYKVSYITFNDSIARDPQNFTDPVHLNNSGAQKVSMTVSTFVDSIIKHSRSCYSPR